LAAIVLAASTMAWQVAHADDGSLSVAAAALQALPELDYVRTLPAPNQISAYGMFQSGTSRLTWSPDGERLAAYVNNGLGIITWSPDGKYQFGFPRHSRFGLDSYLLGFLSGHNQIITSPAAASKDFDDEKKVEEMAFSVMDATTGEVIRGIAGPNPGKTFRENIAQHYSISPDQRLVAVIYHPYAGRSIGIYSTDSWERTATIDVGLNKRTPDPQSITLLQMAQSSQLRMATTVASIFMR
jgi:hypothetical protein